MSSLLDRAADTPLSQAATDVLAERRRQVDVEGWSPKHDDRHNSGELAAAASAYSLAAADKLHPFSQGDGDFENNPPPMWCWEPSWWKPGEPRRMLVKAAALILAEIERIDRAALADERISDLPAAGGDGGRNTSKDTL